jgi:GAF domain-containing protein
MLLLLSQKSDLGRVYHTSDYGTVIDALRAGEVLVLHDDTAGMSAVEQEQFQEYGVKSMMFVPIMAHGQLLGDIELWDSRVRREFTQKDIRLAKAIAGTCRVHY